MALQDKLVKISIESVDTKVLDARVSKVMAV